MEEVCGCRSSDTNLTIIFNCESGVNFLSKVNEEQLALIYPYIDPDFWQKNFIKYHNETEIVKSALKDAGL